MTTKPATEERAVSPLGTDSAQTSSESQCVHHWIIDTPSGATSLGVCKICGAKREFLNYTSDFLWEDNPLDSIPQGAPKNPITELVRTGGDDKDESSFASSGGALGDAYSF